MEKSYLFEVLSSLSTDERSELLRFIKLEYTEHKKTEQSVQRLLQYLIGVLEGEGFVLEKEQVYHAVFPGQATVDGKLEKCMVEANRQLRHYLLYRYLVADGRELDRQHAWVKILESRGLPDWRQQNLQKLQKMIAQAEAQKADDYYDRFRCDFLLHQHEAAYNRLKGDLHVPQALQSLRTFYLLKQLELLNAYLLQKKVTKLPEDTGTEALLDTFSIQDEALQESPVLLIAYKIFLLLKHDTPSLEQFRELSDLLRTHERSVAPDLLKEYYTYLRNSCAFLINAGATHLMEELHQLQRDNLGRGYLYHEGDKISASAYISVATTALKSGNVHWAYDFIEAHRGRIIGDNEQQDLYRLNMANCLFALQQYDKALDLLPPVFDYLNYTLLGKRLELKILYELESDLLSYKANAFKIFISRASQKFMPDTLRVPNGEFINLLLQLIGSQPGNKQRSERLTQRIKAKPMSAEKEWLLEKAAKL